MNEYGKRFFTGMANDIAAGGQPTVFAGKNHLHLAVLVAAALTVAAAPRLAEAAPRSNAEITIENTRDVIKATTSGASSVQKVGQGIERGGVSGYANAISGALSLFEKGFKTRDRIENRGETNNRALQQEYERQTKLQNDLAVRAAKAAEIARNRGLSTGAIPVGRVIQSSDATAQTGSYQNVEDFNEDFSGP